MSQCAVTSITNASSSAATNRAVSRCSLLLAIDVATECVLGFHVCPTKHPTQTDILSLLDVCLTPSAPRTPGLSTVEAPPGPAFPKELSPAPYLGFETVQLDNAWIHHSHAVSDFLCRQMGATVSYGLPARPKTRALVERTFNYLERHLGHRVDSTTGSYPTDPIRESKNNTRNAPLLTYQKLLDSLYLVLGTHNQSPKPHLGGSAPLALFEHHLDTHWRPPPPLGAYSWDPFGVWKTVPVHRPQHDGRNPYVHCFYCRYSGPGLLSLPPETKRIIVRYDQRDMRQLLAQTLEGRSLGVLSAPRSWQRFPHSLQTRRYLFKLKKSHRASSNDPLTDYFLELARGRRTPTTAAELLRVYLEFSPSGQASLTLGGDPPGEKPSVDNADARSSPRNSETIVWSPLSWSKAEEQG